MATKRTAKKSTTQATSAPMRTTRKPATRATTKSAPVKSTPKSTVAAEKPFEKSTATTSTTSTKSVRIRKPYVALVITILLLGALLYYFRGLFVAAVVNGQPISRLEVIRQTEQQSGKQTIDTLVRNSLIEQKAKKDNVTVSEKEINDEIKKLQTNLSKQGQNLDQVLQAQSMSKEDLRRLIRLDKLVAKMVGKDVKVTDEEVNKYIADNKESLPQQSDEKALKKQVTEQLKQQKTNEKVRNWLANLQKEANIRYYVSY